MKQWLTGMLAAGVGLLSGVFPLMNRICGGTGCSSCSGNCIPGVCIGIWIGILYIIQRLRRKNRNMMYRVNWEKGRLFGVVSNRSTFLDEK